MAGAVIAVAYALRAIGDVGRPGARRGCRRSAGTRRMHPFSGLRWWPALLLLGLAAVAAAGAAYALFGRRDFGGGLVGRASRARPGGAGPDHGARVRLAAPARLDHRLGRRGCAAGAGLRLDRRRRRHPDRRLHDVAGRLRPGRRRAWSTGSTPWRSRWSRWSAPASPCRRRCGRAPRRTTGGSRRCWRPVCRVAAGCWRRSRSRSSGTLLVLAGGGLGLGLGYRW